MLANSTFDNPELKEELPVSLHTKKKWWASGEAFVENSWSGLYNSARCGT